MSNHRILSKTDAVLVAYLIGQNAGTAADVFAARRSSDKVLPCTIVESKAWQSPEGQEFAGNAVVDVDITVKCDSAVDVDSDAATVEAAAESRAGATFDAIEAGTSVNSTELASALNSVAVAEGIAWTAFGAVVTGGSRTQDGDAWLDTITLQIHCAPSTIS